MANPSASSIISLSGLPRDSVTRGPKTGLMLEGPLEMSMSLEIPVEEYPEANLIGRLLGPRGSEVKKLEQATGCRIFINGPRIKPYQEAVVSDQKAHVLIKANGWTREELQEKLDYAALIIKPYLNPEDVLADSIKTQQLEELERIKRERGYDSGYSSRSSTPSFSGRETAEVPVTPMRPVGLQHPVPAQMFFCPAPPSMFYRPVPLFTPAPYWVYMPSAQVPF